MYVLIEYTNNYSKTSRSLWRHWKDALAVNNNGEFNGAMLPIHLILKQK